MSAKKASKSVRVRTRLGPYSRQGALALLDKRSKEAIFLKRYRAELVAHCGGAPSATQRAQIERASWLALRCSQLDEKLAAGTLNETDSKTYLAWSSALSRVLRALGPPAAAKVPTLADIAAEIASRREGVPAQ